MTQDIKRILYATDLSANSTYAFGYAINLASKFDASITILYVIDKTMEPSQMILHSYLTEAELEENSQKRINHITEEINQRLKTLTDQQLADHQESVDIVTSIEICQGYPADEILKKAGELDCNAIVMGTHGKGILSRTFFGSVAKRVLRRVRIPVLVIPLPE
jgi:nucleotide-binding universal stress UspA family protein